MNSGFAGAQQRVDELRAEFEALETLILRGAGSEAADVRSDEVFVELGAAERELARLRGKPYVIDCNHLPTLHTFILMAGLRLNTIHLLAA